MGWDGIYVNLAEVCMLNAMVRLLSSSDGVFVSLEDFLGCVARGVWCVRWLLLWLIVSLVFGAWEGWAKCMSEQCSLCFVSWLQLSLRLCARLDALLSLFALRVPLRVDHTRERILPAPSNAIRCRNKTRQQHTRGLSKPQRGREETKRRAMVHGCIGDIEGKRGNRFVHQDAKVVTQICARDAEGVHAGEHEGVAHEEERDRGVLDEGVEEGRVRGLRGESFIVAVIY